MPITCVNHLYVIFFRYICHYVHLYFINLGFDCITSCTFVFHKRDYEHTNMLKHIFI